MTMFVVQVRGLHIRFHNHAIRFNPRLLLSVAQAVAALHCRATLSAGPPHVAVPVTFIFNMGVGGRRKSRMRKPQQMLCHVAKHPSDDAVCQNAKAS